MKILFLSKRRPQGKDLLTRPYGRFFHIPRLLAERGHDITILLLSHTREPSVTVKKEGLTWISESIFPTGPFAYVAKARRLVKQVEPDWIVGFSDTYYGILAVMLAEKYGILSVIDAYDNYESYIPWLKPLHQLWRRALAKATLVTAAGPHLAEFMASFRPDKKAWIIPMASDPHFQPLERKECRRKLGLPEERKIIGYSGAIHHGRGIETLFRACEKLRRCNLLLELVLTGRKEKGLSIPSGVRWLGYVPDEDMPLVLNSLDVLVVLNQLSDFGKFSYPVKLYEAIRCNIPVVATSTEPAQWILGGRDRFLAKPEDPADMADKIRSALTLDRAHYGQLNTWEHSGRLFERALLSPLGSALPRLDLRRL